MAALARKEGFKPIVPPLLTAKATAANVVNAIKKAAATLAAGDTLFLTYAGHGAQIPDTNGDEPDQMDETWCLYDRMLIDDELAALWASFRPGVRIIMLSDSCHSGSVSRAARRGAVERPAAGKRYRTIPLSRALGIYRNHKGIYDAIQLGTKTRSQTTIQASVLLISGCQDNQLSGDGDVNGLFTETLKSVWNGGVFEGTYKKLRDTVAALMPRYQQPRYSLEGAANATLEQERPFSPVAGAKPGAVKGGKPAPKEKPSSPLTFVLSLLKKFGMSKPGAKSDLRAWAKEVEKQDAKLGLPTSRAEAFVAECFAQFEQLPTGKSGHHFGKSAHPSRYCRSPAKYEAALAWRQRWRRIVLGSHESGDRGVDEGAVPHAERGGTGQDHLCGGRQAARKIRRERQHHFAPRSLCRLLLRGWTKSRQGRSRF